MEYKGLLELKDFLQGEGFKFQRNSDPYGLNLCNWYAYRKVSYPAPLCSCNEKEVQLVVYPNLIQFPGMQQPRASVEVEICAAIEYQPDDSSQELWFKLKAYSLTPESFVDCSKDIEKKLVDAWIAVNK